jgi:hypothetical protein
MNEEEIAGDSTDIWREGVIERYEKRPKDMLADVSLAQFVSRWYKKQNGTYTQRKKQDNQV